MAYRIAICDDEQAEVEKLSAIVNDWSAQCGSSCEVCSFASAEAFLFAYDICDHFNIERSSAYNKKNRAVQHLALLLYGK